MDLSVITVTWNSAKYIEKQIQSTRQACIGLEYEQIIVDNNSSDETVEITNDQSVKIMENKENKGFGFANNQGVKETRGKYILFLNPDMRFVESTKMKDMVEYMEQNTDVGIMGCKLLNEDGIAIVEQRPRRFPKAWQMLALILKIPHVFPKILNKYYYQDINLNDIQSVDSVRGAFMLVRRSVIEKIGTAFDQRYFLWWEEVDFCREVKKIGFKVIYNPEFSCIDLAGKSFSQVNNVKKQKQFTKSLLIYFKKWEPLYKWIWIQIFRPVGVLLVWIFKK